VSCKISDSVPPAQFLRRLLVRLAPFPAIGFRRRQPVPASAQVDPSDAPSKRQPDRNSKQKQDDKSFSYECVEKPTSHFVKLCRSFMAADQQKVFAYRYKIAGDL